MALDVATSFPARGSLALLDVENTTSLREFTFPMNPTELEESIDVNWVEQRVVGHSHPILQYTGTGPHNLPGVKFYVSAHALSQERNKNLDGDDVLEFKRFLQSLTVPRGNAGDIVGGSPPRVLFIWPNVVSLVCVVRNVRFRHLRFARDGSVLVYVATVTFSEIRDARMTSEEVFFEGSRRAGI